MNIGISIDIEILSFCIIFLLFIG